MLHGELYSRLSRELTTTRHYGIVGVVFIPVVHTSAYGWLNYFNSLACGMLFQWLPSADLEAQIKQAFRFSHAIAVTDPDNPPTQVLNTVDRWLANLPTTLADHGLA